jgi:hypothetical protein
VNDTKIYNVDFQNRAQIRGVIETIRKALKAKNVGLNSTLEAMKNQILAEQQNQNNIYKSLDLIEIIEDLQH